MIYEKIVGETAGSLATGFGDIYEFELPKSKLIVNVSHKIQYRPNKNSQISELRPDIQIKKNIQSLRENRDEYLNIINNIPE